MPATTQNTLKSQKNPAPRRRGRPPKRAVEGDIVDALETLMKTRSYDEISIDDIVALAGPLAFLSGPFIIILEI